MTQPFTEHSIAGEETLCATWQPDSISQTTFSKRLMKNKPRPAWRQPMPQLNFQKSFAQDLVGGIEEHEGRGKRLLRGSVATTMHSSTPIMQREDGATAMESRDDLFLLQAIAQQRDKEAFAELYRRYEQRAFNLASRILRNPALAQDAVQEAMLTIWLSEKSIELRSAEDWIMKIVLTKTLKLRRGHWRSANLDQRAGAAKNKTEPTAAGEAEQNEVVRLLRDRIDQLPELESTLLTCSFAANLPHREIAKLVNIPHRTVTYKIQQALQRLRSDLAKAGIAAVVPALNAGLFEALTTGHVCPPGMMNEIVGQVTNQERPLPSRRMASLRGGWVLKAMGLAVLVAGAACGVAWALHGGNPAVAPQKSASTSAAAARTWNFNSAEQAKDFKVIQGAWHWAPTNGLDGSGCMESETDDLLVAELDIPVGSAPLEISVRSLPILPAPGAGYLHCVIWGHYRWLASFHNLGQPIMQTAGNPQWSHVREFLTRDFIDSWTNHQRTSFMAGEMTPNSKLRLMVRGRQRLDELSIREISREELPDVHEFQAAVAKLTPSQRVGTIVVPELKSARPGSSVTIDFESGADKE